ncbi:DUF2783 domain-containing protein [Bradyrhizobium sp. SZCCHNRI3043]|uniref:DUF2783 domain-containing protein n=1 Tax=Bradyrhizobium sp. SZCCHNRI3043 TaxID=3057292 RepID=UPI0028EE944B|nr:DUF2783 domain-containing protein [Bradyrhizobium sp. SZCCHNRI3043]
MSLTLPPNISDPDDFYAELIGGQRDLSEDEALRMNARLVLLLANHIGDRAILSEAIRLARSPAG